MITTTPHVPLPSLDGARRIWREYPDITRRHLAAGIELIPLNYVPDEDVPRIRPIAGPGDFNDEIRIGTLVFKAEYSDVEGMKVVRISWNGKTIAMETATP